MSLNLNTMNLYCYVPMNTMMKKIILLVFGVLISMNLLAQETEAEILSQANSLFKSEKYVEATPYYLRLLSLSPTSPNYSYRYGTCLLFNADKKQEALRYLKFATENPNIEPLAYYFLGKAYHVNYLFNDAVRSYEKFASLDPKNAANYNIGRLVETCQNGRRLLMNYSEMIVYEKKEIEADKFFRLYDLKDIGGSIVVNAEFQSKLDKRNGHIPLIYFGKNASEIYYSSFGDGGENGKDIYRRRRKPTGGWGDPELLRGMVNTRYDEDFCYRSQDGKYLYFSSKGHNSMGGYDVFRSEYNESTDSFGEPENMDFAVSSPDDDIFFLVDAKNENGYFASARQSEIGKLYVYKIRVDKLPTQLTVIAGRYESKISTTPARLNVEVENPEGKIVGKFQSDKNGQIILSFPTGGQYKYKMNLSGSSQIYTANVNVPYKKAIKPMRQSFMHFMENNQEVVRVLDRFDEAVPDKDDVMAALFAEKANLDPNSEKFDLNNLNKVKETELILAQAGAEGWTMSEVAIELEGKAKAIREMENKAGNIEKKAAAQIEQEIKNIKTINEKLAKNSADYRQSENNSMTQQNLLLESKQLLQAKRESEDKIQDLLDINKNVQENLVLYQDLKKRAVDWEKKGAELKQLLREDKNDEALELIAQNKVIIKSAVTDTVDDYQLVTTMDISELNKEMTTLNALKFNYETSSKDLRNNIDYQEKSLVEGTAQNPQKTKENIQSKKKDLIVIHNEITNIENTLKEKREIKERLVDELSEYNKLDNSPMPNNLVQMQVAKNHWEDMKNAPEQKEAEYLAEIIRAKEDGTLANVDPVKTEPTTAKNPAELLAIVNPTYNSNVESINKNTSLSATDKANQLMSVEQENKAKLQTKLTEINKNIQSKPNDAVLAQEKNNITQLLAKTENNIQAYNDQIEYETSAQIASTLDVNSVSNKVDKTYKEVKTFLMDDTSLEEKSKLKSLVENDQAYLKKVENRKVEVQKQLKEQPNKKPELEKELEILNELALTAQNDITMRKSDIANLDQVAQTNQSASTFAKMTPKEQEKTILNEINQSYISQKETFGALSSPSVTDLQSEIALDEKMVFDLNQKIKDLNPQIQKEEIAAYKRLITDTQSDIAQNMSNLAQLESQVASTDPVPNPLPKELVNTESNQELLSRINTTYESKNKTIQNNTSLSELDKTKQLITLDNQLITSLNQELSRVEDFLTANPEAESLTYKKDQLQEIIAEKQQLLSSRENRVSEIEAQIAAAETKPATTNFAQLSNSAQEEAIRERMKWSYQADRNEIEAVSQNIEEKTIALIALDKATQNKLADEKSKLNKQTQAAEIAAIERIQESIQESLSNNQMTLIALPESKDELLARLNKTYLSNRETIQNNNALSETDKTKQLIALDQDMVAILENEQDKYSRLGKDNPQVGALTEKENEIAQVVDVQKTQINELKENLKTLENQVATTDPQPNPVNTNTFASMPNEAQQKTILAKLNPDYENQKLALTQDGNVNKANLDRAIALDQSMLADLQTEKSKLEKGTQVAELKAIERLETKIGKEIQSNELLAKALPESQPELLTRIAGSPTNQLKSLEANASLSELEKTNQAIALNEETVQLLKKEKAMIEVLSKQNPGNAGLSTKVGDINTLIFSKQADIAVLNQKAEKLNELASTTEPTQATNVKKGFVTIGDLREELLTDVSTVDEIQENSIDKLNLRIEKLESYEKDLIKLDENLDFLETEKNENHKEERAIIEEEIATVQTLKKKAKITLGELETQNVENQVASTNAKYEDAALQRLVEKENKLRVELDKEVSMKEARKIEKKLIQTIDDRIEKENDITQEYISKAEKDNKEVLDKLKSIENNTVTERLTLELAENKYNKINQEADALKAKAKKAKSPQEEAELLAKALVKQNEASEMLEMSYVDAKIDRMTKGKINSLMTNEEIQTRRNTLLIEESNLNAQISSLDEQIKNATKEKEREVLLAERTETVNQRTRINDDIARLDKKIATAPQPGKQTFPANAKETELTYLEERKIAESAVYKELSRASYDIKFLENEIETLLKSIDKDKADAQELVQLSLAKSDDKIDELILNKVEAIKTKELRLKELKVQLEKRQLELQNLMPKNPTEIANVNNLLIRGVDPMSKSDAVDFVSIPKDGFSINTQNTSNTVKAKPIATETPTGLLYRVQVGAFRNPVAEDVFNEFTPVSAEKRSNGILVYMAGFFADNKKAVDAQKSIRSIGYTDAFVVAYCDGKRITLAEARRLEETNACAPIRISEISIQAEAPKDTTKVMVTELDYYKGIGAAPAFPVETKKGLFYTVQLGVYNRPVSKETLKNMSPLITKRLPNGQIRYSAGVYVSIEEAFPKREQAFERGISDAYITVYYNGERITLAEAEKLLQTQGTGIIEKTAIGIVKDVDSRLKAEQKLAEDIQKIVDNKLVEGMKIQLVSKKQFDEFPRDILNRFNSHASFYFDLNDKRIKSNLYQKIEDIPQVYFLRNEIDTTYISDKERVQNVVNKDLRNLEFEISSTQLGGDLTDLLLRLNYRKEFIQVGEVIKVIVHEIPSGQVQSISDRLRTLKIRSEVVDPAR